MTRYKESIKSEQNNRIGTQTTTQNKNVNQTQLKLKRKLLVYRENGKFFIDHAAAYALHMTKTRAIMLDKPKLIEVNLEFLHRMQNDDTIELEYKDLERGKDSNEKEEEDLKETLEGLKQEEYGIGVHGIDRGSVEEKQGKAISINNEGLNFNNNSRTILSTSISLGINGDSESLYKDITEYSFGSEAKMTSVIAAPLCIKNKKGERIFLGFPEENRRTSGQQYEEHCILDRICGKMGRIPPEFILGYYTEQDDGKKMFEPNQRHYSNLSVEEREGLFELLSNNMDDFSKNINDLISKGNIDRLNQIKESMQSRGMNTHMIDNAMELALKHNKDRHFRRVYFGGYKNAGESSLLEAKGLLTEQNEIENGKKEEVGG